MRSKAREAVFQYVFSRLFNQNDEGLFAVLTRALKPEDGEFAKKLSDLVIVGDERYDGEINVLSENFRPDRIFAADRCAIKIGMAELDAFTETDVPIIIDEAVKLAAKFSTENSPDFVNGILASYAKKTGRI